MTDQLPPEVLRTPDERFATLPDFPYAPQYIELLGFKGLRYAYIDEGPREAALTFLCLHGEPSWSFLYRRMLPVFLAAGHRVIAPDHFGFGRSDKPSDPAFYTFMHHRQALVEFIEQLGLTGLCLVVQDWGGLLGLTLPMDMPERFSHLIAMNTALAIGVPPGDGFMAWRQFVRDNPNFDVGRFIQSDVGKLSTAEIAAYDAPFPSDDFKEGVRRFPELVAINPDQEGADLSRRALAWFRTEWRGKAFMAIGARDTIIPPPVMHALAAAIHGCADPMVIPEAGHFVQEFGKPVARAALTYFGEIGSVA